MSLFLFFNFYYAVNLQIFLSISTKQKWQNQLGGESRLLFLARLALFSIINCQQPRMVFSFTFLSWQTSQPLLAWSDFISTVQLPNYTSFFLRPAAAVVIFFFGQDIISMFSVPVSLNTIWMYPSVLHVYSLVLFFSFTKQTEMLMADEYHDHPRLS